MAGVPLGVRSCTFTGRVHTLEQVEGSDPDPDAVPVTGEIIFTPSVRRLLHRASGTFFVPLPFRAALDEAGAFSVIVTATDDATLDAMGWTYRVSFELVGAELPSFDVSAPGGAVISLTDAAPGVRPSMGAPITEPMATLAALGALSARVDALDARVSEPFGETSPGSGIFVM